MVWLAPAIAATAALIGRIADQRRQKKANSELAKTQASANQAYQTQQNQYNSPAAQMARYKAAGLNPYLVYQQGTPGNQSSSLSYPQIQPTDYSDTFSSVGSNFLSAQAMQTQVSATEAKTKQVVTQTELNKIQKAVLEKNPLLNEEGFNAIINSLVSTAKQKAAEAGMSEDTSKWFSGQESFNINGVPMHGPAGIMKLELGLKMLENQFNLQGQDAQIKANIINSGEFKNAIMELEKNFMKDGDISPGHIMQFIKLLLLKMF